MSSPSPGDLDTALLGLACTPSWLQSPPQVSIKDNMSVAGRNRQLT